MRTWNVGTRGSLLAWTQTGHAVASLEAARPGETFGRVRIETRGDRDQSTPLPLMSGTGLFTKELERALLDGRIDVAVHSLKDVPYEVQEGCTLGGFLVREDPRDAWISPHGSWDLLPRGARVGTSSPRRIAQLRALRPDFVFEDLRGNLDTRLRKLDEGRYDAIVLAAAGLRRLGMEARITALLDPAECLPAFGQGILALECRADDADARALLASVDVAAARHAAELERLTMLALGGGCKVALAALAEPEGAAWRLRALVGDPATGGIVRREWRGQLDAARGAIGDLARDLLAEARAAGLVAHVA